MSTSRYEASGVSIDAQDKAINRIKAGVAKTMTPRVLSGIGSFGGLFDISFPDMTQPVLVASADGVGTKLKIAFDADRHDTVGQCLVNHCINDILVQGAKPLFFMDYVATGKLKPEVVAQVVEGMCTACAQSDLALLGGEMAEMPGFYQAGEYDVAGFIVGVVDRPKLLGADRVKKDQVLIGLESSGLHTNGYSLARTIVFDEQKLGLNDLFPGTDQTVAETMLAIHRSYYRILWPLLQEDRVAAMAHITGGGFLDNLPRVLPPDVSCRIDTSSYPIPPLFRFLCDAGEVAREEAYRVFNMGIGMILIIDADQESAVHAHLKAQALPAWTIGKTVAGNQKVLI